jgi:hypothetical protein
MRTSGKRASEDFGRRTLFQNDVDFPVTMIKDTLSSADRCMFGIWYRREKEKANINLYLGRSRSTLLKKHQP